MLCRRALASEAVSKTAARVLLVLATAGLALDLDACATGNAEPSGSGGHGGAAIGGTAATSGSGVNAPTLSIRATNADGLDVDRLHLKPSSIANIVVTTTPPGAHALRFALLGAPLDAVLGATDALTDPDSGAAQITLVAPSTPTTFSVRASTTGVAPALLDLAVPKTGMALLAVNPSYPGERVVKGYVASATVNATCADLQGSPPMDGPITASSTRFPVPLLVPTDTRLAVTLRAASFAWGCTTVNAAVEGVQNDVEVVMTNVPMKLDASDVDFTLELAEDPQNPSESLLAFQAALAEPEQALLAALLGTADDDVQALLDEMQADAPDASAFRTARTNLAWDARVRAELGSAGTDALRAPLARWIEAGTDADHVAGGLAGSLHGVSGGPPDVTLSLVFGVAPSRAGFTPEGTPVWEAGADDGVLIGMSMAVSPAAFLDGAAHGPAVHEATGAGSVSEALAAVLSCTQVADALVAHGTSSAHSTADCDRGCTEELCRNAVHALLANALASDEEPSTLDIALTGSGSVGDDAELTGFNGNWLGHWSLNGGTVNLSGVALGAAPK
jgi:hypothetical protein